MPGMMSVLMFTEYELIICVTPHATGNELAVNLSLHTKWAKVNPIPDTSTLWYSSWRISSEVDHFVIFT